MNLHESIIAFCGTILAIWISLVASGTVHPESPTVKIDQGILRGKFMRTSDDKQYKVFSAFLGIPYAEPPVGNLRLKAPIPAGPWSGIRNASEDSTECFQLGHGKEDCLYLNVYTPHGARSVDKVYPVMAFIYGGAFFLGDAKSTTYGPQHLLEKDVILVTINYRLGRLGFLTFESDVLPGNYGLKDQTLALKWIKRNIKAFGGNPDDVTLFGESAGALSVALHLVSPLSKGLFKRVITESGSSINFWSVSHEGQNKGLAHAFAKYNGCNYKHSDEQAILECLQKLPADAFVPILNDTQFLFELPSLNIGAVREPTNTIDPFLTENPWNEIIKPSNVPWIMGINSAEGVFVANGAYPNLNHIIELMDTYSEWTFPSLFGYLYTQTNQSANATRKIKEFYFPKKPMVESYDEFAQLITDRAFLQPAIDSVRYYNGPKYVYYYDFVSEARRTAYIKDNRTILGASHADELLNLFYNEQLTPKPVPENEKKLSEAIVEYWTNYAIYGTPNSKHSRLPKWNLVKSNEVHKPIKPDDIDYLYINQKNEENLLEMRTGLLTDRYNFWNSLGFKHDF